MTTEERLFKREELKEERERLYERIRQIDNDLEKTYYPLTWSEEYERLRNRDVENRHCCVCGHRDKNDFILDGCVCTHPSHQNGKDRFVFKGHTCEFWVEEDK